VARAWLSGQQVLEERFAGRSDEWRRLTIPMSLLAGGEAREILLAREGQGRLYVRLGLRCTPSGLNLPPVEIDDYSDWEGIFLLPQLPPGRYRLDVEAGGRSIRTTVDWRSGTGPLELTFPSG
jgi:hypothetical protein